MTALHEKPEIEWDLFPVFTFLYRWFNGI